MSFPPRLVQWNKLPVGYVKINTNGHSLRNPNIVGIGELVLDCVGNWIIGFSCYIGLTSNMYAELATTLHGLLVVIEIGASQALVEIESIEDVCLIEGGTNSTHASGMTIEDIGQILKDNTSFNIYHILKKKLTILLICLLR